MLVVSKKIHERVFIGNEWFKIIHYDKRSVIIQYKGWNKPNTYHEIPLGGPGVELRKGLKVFYTKHAKPNFKIGLVSDTKLEKL